MASRLELQAKLQELMGDGKIYYQTPENLKMVYPCIRFSRSDIESTHADNMKYSNFTLYQITVISKTPDHNVINKILELPMSSYDRHYVKDNLNHDVINLYY